MMHSHYVYLEDDHAYRLWSKLFTEVSAKSGMDFFMAAKLKSFMEEAGFVNIQEQKLRIAVGSWPKNPRHKMLGMWNQARLDAGIRDFTERRMKNTLNVSCLHWIL